MLNHQINGVGEQSVVQRSLVREELEGDAAILGGLAPVVLIRDEGEMITLNPLFELVGAGAVIRGVLLVAVLDDGHGSEEEGQRMAAVAEGEH